MPHLSLMQVIIELLCFLKVMLLVNLCFLKHILR